MTSSEKQTLGWQQYLTQYRGYDLEEAKRVSLIIVTYDRKRRGLPVEI